MSTTTTLYLSQFDSEVTMDICAAILAIEGDASVDASATALLYVGLTKFKNMIKFNTDASDVDDLSANDVRFVVDTTHLNLDNGNLNPVYADVSSGHANGVSTYTHDMVAMDVVRQIATDVFQTERAVDLFHNEEALLDELATLGGGVHDSIKSILDSNNNRTYDNSGIDLDTSNNLVAKIFSHLLATQPERFITAISGDASYSMPFIEGDKLVYKLTVIPKNTIVGLESAINSGDLGTPKTKTYQIVLHLTDDVNNVNTDPNDHQAFSGKSWYDVSVSA